MTESQVPFLCRAEVRHSAIPLQEVVRSCSVVNPSPTASSSMSLPQQLHDSPQDVALYNEFPIPVRKSSRVYVQSSVAPVASVGPTTFRPSSSVLTPPALRKSVSVDSFPHYSRELRVVRGQAPATSRNFPSQSRLDKHILAGRLRGESLSSPYTSNRPVDTDRDRYDPPTSDGRRSITKAYDVRSLIRGGDLPLPSRSHNHSTVLSTSSTAPTSPPSSRTPSQKRAATRPDSGGGNRRRSGSAGYAVPLSSKKIAINTQIPPIPVRHFHVSIFSIISYSLLVHQGHRPRCSRNARLWQGQCDSQGSFWIWTGRTSHNIRKSLLSVDPIKLKQIRQLTVSLQMFGDQVAWWLTTMTHPVPFLMPYKLSKERSLPQASAFRSGHLTCHLLTVLSYVMTRRNEALTFLSKDSLVRLFC